MRQDDLTREVGGPARDGRGERVGTVREVAPLRVCADDHLDSIARQKIEDPVVPQRRAFGPRRPVAGAARAGVAEAHRDQRDQIGIVELLGGEAEPLAQTAASGVVPGYAALMHPTPGA